MIANIISTILYAPLAYFLMFTLDYGVLGFAYTNVFKTFLLLIATIIYCKCSEETKKVM